MPDTYTHGHHESVLRSHRWRTAENSAAYLLPHLRSGMALLDVGCGPGNITCDLADRVAPGPVVGLDVSAEVVTAAATDAEARGTANVAFQPGDLYALEFDDDAFDVVHAHQVLQHLTDPVAALAELRRVVRPDGVVAAPRQRLRGDDLGPRRAPPRPLARALPPGHGPQRGRGRRRTPPPGLGPAAGFASIEVSSSTWTYADVETRAWWADLWADRVGLPESALAAQALEYGLATQEELADLAEGWRSWATAEDGVFIVVHGEVLARG